VHGHRAMARAFQEMESSPWDYGIAFWSGVQSFLSGIANISKLLYPNSRGNQGRGTFLRGLVGESVAAEFDHDCRTVRNAYEHSTNALILGRTWTYPAKE
jgi:hypothetical protein